MSTLAKVTLIDRRILREKERRGDYATFHDNSEFFVELWRTGDEERDDADVYIYMGSVVREDIGGVEKLNKNKGVRGDSQ